MTWNSDEINNVNIDNIRVEKNHNVSAVSFLLSEGLLSQMEHSSGYGDWRRGPYTDIRRHSELCRIVLDYRYIWQVVLLLQYSYIYFIRHNHVLCILITITETLAPLFNVPVGEYAGR